MKTIFIAGAGTMGHGIAQVAATAGFPVLLYDLDAAATKRGLERIRWSLGKQQAKQPDLALEEILARITPTNDLDAAAGAGLVIEAILEQSDTKRAFFSRLDEVSPEETIFCSNTSAIPITLLAAATKRPDRFCGMHFFSPVPLMPLVEVIRGLVSSDETVAEVMALAAAFGKKPVEVRLDRAGFIVNRILIASLLEAIRVLDAGVADAATIDFAMCNGCGHKMGPLATADLSGLDVFLHAAEAIYAETGDLKYQAPPLLRRMVEAGHLGRKSGRGFFTY